MFSRGNKALIYFVIDRFFVFQFHKERDLPLSLFRGVVFYGNNRGTTIITEKGIQY